MAEVVPTQARQDKAAQRYQGQAATAWLTNGLIYSTSTVLADITALSAANKLSVAISSISAPVAGVISETITWTNSTGSTFTFTGAAFVINGRSVIETCNNDLANSIPNGQTYSTTLILTVT